MVAGEPLEQATVLVGEIAKVAQDQGAIRVAQRQLDLRNPLRARQTLDQLFQRDQQRRGDRVQHLAMVQGSDVALAALAKADQNAALAGNDANAQSRTPTVAPLRTDQRLEQLLWPYPAGALQAVQQRRLLELQLPFTADVLQAATAATPEVRARRLDSFVGGLENCKQARRLPAPPLAQQFDLDALARQRAVDEHVVAVDLRNAAPVAGQPRDAHDAALVARRGRAAAFSHHAPATRRCRARATPAEIAANAACSRARAPPARARTRCGKHPPRGCPG